MAVQKPSIPKGTRDFSPIEMVRRNHVFDTIRGIFQVFGYLPIETPAMENLSTLMGKYGEEGDKLLFNILNSGNYLEGLKGLNDVELNHKETTRKIAEKGLRYDLTVPFARFVVQYQNELSFPFKRYQIQPVWRADRPQRGRYREFYQCDVDVIGSDSLLNEVELIQIIDAVFCRLGINVKIHLNNRKILSGIAGLMGEESKLTDITVAIDKMDKIGFEKVCEELVERGIPGDAIEKLKPLMLMKGTVEEKLLFLSGFFKDSIQGSKGVEEFVWIYNYLRQFDLQDKIELDLTLARGLNYYTGTIIEVKALDVSIGSICGGGRYDDLTGIFGLPGMSGVGISFGADRIYDVLAELNGFPANIAATTQVMFCNFGPEEELACMGFLSQLRKSSIPSEIYPDNLKLKKQLEYANKKNIPFVVMVGKDELSSGKLTLKIMLTGQQESMTISDLIKKIGNK
ncbi:MAG: histidine--tRNA ligase [Bacteroidota bacterium]